MFQCDPPPQVTGEWNPRGSPCITRAKNIARQKKKKRESHHVSPGDFSGFHHVSPGVFIVVSPCFTCCFFGVPLRQ